MSPSRTGYAGGGYDPALAPLNDPNYVPPPVEPGMYEDPYVKPGQYSAPEPLPNLAPSGPAPGLERGEPVEPGMYIPPYSKPGMGNVSLGSLISGQPVEPGMYEPTYVKPGEYATRDSASTYYGGEVWPPVWRGADHPTMTPRPNPNLVITSYPSTGAPRTARTIPNSGTANVLLPGPTTRPPDTLDPSAQSRGQVLGNMAGGGIAPPVPTVTLGPTATQLGYRYQQGDPGVVGVPRLMGDIPHEVERRNLSQPIADQLKGLFGGGEQKSSQVMPLPPGSRRGRNSPPLKRKSR